MQALRALPRTLLLSLMLLALLAGNPPARAAENGERERARQSAAKEEALSEEEREELILRKAILMGFPLAAVGALLIAIFATRGQRRKRREQAHDPERTSD